MVVVLLPAFLLVLVEAVRRPSVQQLWVLAAVAGLPMPGPAAIPVQQQAAGPAGPDT